jgi:hypothetical protein
MVTICTASGHYIYRTVVTICTAQWSLYVPPVVIISTASGHYLYHTVVTICTASGHYLYRTVVTVYTTMFNSKKFYVLPTQCIYVFYTNLIHGSLRISKVISML